MSRISPGRMKLPWFPTINYDLCISDLGCLVFCPYDVFDWEKETGRPIVARPYNCLPGCDMCAQNCTRGAVTLPSKKQMQALMRKLRAELREPSTRSGGRFSRRKPQDCGSDH